MYSNNISSGELSFNSLDDPNKKTIERGNSSRRLKLPTMPILKTSPSEKSKRASIQVKKLENAKEGENSSGMGKEKTPETAQRVASIESLPFTSPSALHEAKTRERSQSQSLLVSKKPTLDKMNEMLIVLQKFAKQYQAELLSLEEKKRNAISEERAEELPEIVQVFHQLLVENEEFRKQWQGIRREMNTILNVPAEELTPSSRETPRHVSKINYDQLVNFVKQLESESKEEDKSKVTISGLPEHLRVATELFHKLYINLDNENYLEKIRQFLNFSGEQKHVIIFNYIEQLVLVAEILRKYATDHSRVKGKSKNKNSPFNLAEDFIDNIKGCKEISKIKPLERQKAAVYRCCQEFADCVMTLAQELAKHLVKELVKGRKDLKVNCLHYLSDQLNHTLIQTATINSCGSFGADLRRAILGRFLELKTDHPQIAAPVIGNHISAEESEEYYQFCVALLNFFAQQVGIDPNNFVHIAAFDPWQKLRETKSLSTVYGELELAWKKQLLLHFYKTTYHVELDSSELDGAVYKPLKTLRETGSISEACAEFELARKKEIVLNFYKTKYQIDLESEQELDQDLMKELASKGLDKPLNIFKKLGAKSAFDELKVREGGLENLYGQQFPKMEGVFRLLPLLRCFSQEALLGLHRGMMWVEKAATGAESRKLVQDLPTSIKLDQETKLVNFDFRGEKVIVTLKRQGALEKPNTIGSPTSTASDLMFTDCLINSIVIFTASVQDLQNWQVEKLIEIEQPKSESENPLFWQRYASLITTLEVMQLPYTVTVK
jgi:hypothetical protein